MVILEKSTFSGPVRAEWIEDEPRAMRLLQDIHFVDSKGVLWTAKSHDVVDGASIPRFFHRVIGCPFVGLYRRASVIHDVYCDNKERPWQDVHRVFHEMMLVDGVPKAKAYTMAKAVWFGGPRW